MSKILIFDHSNNDDIHQLMDKVLSQHSLTYIDDKQQISQDLFDLLIVSISKESDFIKIETIKAPILYITNNNVSLDKQGVDHCSLDSISEPYGNNIFKNMVADTISNFSSKQEHQQEIAEVADAMLSLQNDNAKLQDISRFLQHSFFCQDIHALCEQLFVVTRAFNTSCTLSIHSEKNNFFISDGIKQGEKINNDILKMLKNETRIFQFGQDRAVFNWTNASLLVNHLGDDVDNLAMLMDGFEMGFKAIESVDEFNHVLDKYKKQNFDLNVQVAKVVEDVASNITDKLAQFGATAMFTVEQEDALVELAEQGRDEVDKLFNDGMQLDTELSQIMTRMRTQSESNDNSKDDGDTIDFF